MESERVTSSRAGWYVQNSRAVEAVATQVSLQGPVLMGLILLQEMRTDEPNTCSFLGIIHCNYQEGAG